MKSQAWGLLILISLLVGAPMDDLRADSGTAFGGRWTGHWTNTTGQTGDDTLELAEDAAQNLYGTWSGNVSVSGRQTNATTIALHARTQTRDYQITGFLQGEVLILKYVATRLDQPGSYSGQSTFTRMRSSVATHQSPPNPIPSTPKPIASLPNPAPAPQGLQPSPAKALEILPPLPTPTLPPPDSPALPMPARLDINLVSATQYAGEVSAAAEAMRALQGPLSGDDQKKFEAKWAPYFNFPAPESADYFKKLNPLLQEYLHLRTAIPGITTEMAAAWREAVMLSGYNSEAAVREALGEARMQEQLLQGINARMAEIMRQVQALGDPPDATQAKAHVRKRHDDAVAVAKKMLPTFTLVPASQANTPGTPCVFTPRANQLPAGVTVKWDFGDGKGADASVQPMQHAYAQEGEFAVTARLLDGKTHAVLATTAAKAKITTEKIKGVWMLQKVDRKFNAGNYSGDHDVLTGTSSPNAIHAHLKGVGFQTKPLLTPEDFDSKGATPEVYSFGDSDTDYLLSYESMPQTLAEGAHLRSGASLTVSRSGEMKYFHPPGPRSCGIYFYTNLPTTDGSPGLPPGSDHDGPFFNSLGLRCEGGFSASDVAEAKDADDSVPLGTRSYKGDALHLRNTKGDPLNMHVAPAGTPGKTWLVRFLIEGPPLLSKTGWVLSEQIEDFTYTYQPVGTPMPNVVTTEQKNEAVPDAVANQQRISELQNEVSFINESISRLQAQRNTARDVPTAQKLDYQIMQAQTDRLAELDLVASLKTGQDVHTRSPFDDYAQQTFVASIRDKQLRMAESQREAAGLFKFAEIGDDRDGMRDFIQRELVASGAIARGDIAAVRKVANALNNRVVGYWQGQQAKSEEAAINAEENIFIANSVITASTILVSGGMSEVGAIYIAPSWVGTAGTMVYAGTTGYIASGSPTEALKQSVAWSSTVGMVATSMYDGYQDGGGWSGALTGAGKGLAIGWLTGKASELVVAKWGTGPAFKTPPPRERPPTVKDFLDSREFRQAQVTGKAKVKAFEDAQAQVQAASQGSASPERLKQLQDAVKARANDVNADQHAKMFLLKSGQGNPASVHAYENYHRAIHAEVEARFHEIMEQDLKFNHQEVAPVRNATSTGTAGMDYDLALKEGSPIIRNGQASSVSEWQQAAKGAYDRAFQEATGHSAEEAWENITTTLHAESYKDIGNTPGEFEGWLCNLRKPENVAKLRSDLAQQATDVTRFKAWEFQNNKTMGEFSKLQEICRGTAKDMKTKLDPVLAAAKTSTAVEAEAVRQSRAYWQQVQEVMEDFGSNRIGPITAKQKLYQLTGKESVQEVIDQMGVTMQGAVQWGR